MKKMLLKNLELENRLMFQVARNNFFSIFLLSPCFGVYVCFGVNFLKLSVIRCFCCFEVNILNFKLYLKPFIDLYSYNFVIMM